ncbi:MAG: YgcG family protein, partial [Betaproteobacteria bacterium]
MLKRWLGLVAAGVLLAGLGSTRAEVAVPPLKAHVTDLTGTLSAQQLRDLESRLAAFERGKGSQVAVLMLPSTQPETIEEYSIRVADAWKIGRARAEDGVILVVAKNDRKLRFEVGTGLEGAIPDVIAKRIVSDVIAPHFRSGDFYGGIAAGTDAVMKLIEGEGLPAPQSGVIIKGVHHAIDFQTIFLLFVALVVTDAIFRRLF